MGVEIMIILLLKQKSTIIRCIIVSRTTTIKATKTRKMRSRKSLSSRRRKSTNSNLSRRTQCVSRRKKTLSTKTSPAIRISARKKAQKRKYYLPRINRISACNPCKANFTITMLRRHRKVKADRAAIAGRALINISLITYLIVDNLLNSKKNSYTRNLIMMKVLRKGSLNWFLIK